MKLTLIILGEPKPKQSFRVAVIGGKVHKYQKADVKKAENNIQLSIIQQLPLDFEPTEKPIRITKLHYVFTPLSSFSKKTKEAISNGMQVFKHTKPDLTDNLSKGLFDAMQGIVFRNDSQICSMDNVKKVYGNRPRIEIEMEF